MDLTTVFVGGAGGGGSMVVVAMAMAGVLVLW